MSQLNKENKKNHSTRNLICFVILFASIVISITIYSVNSKLNEENNQNLVSEEFGDKSVNPKKDDGVSGVKSLYETYECNNLDVEQYFYGVNGNEVVDITEQEKYDSDSDEEFEITVYYPEISGLKNKDIEKKINNQIKETLINKAEENFKSDMKKLDISTHISGNFSNILSITVNEYHEFDDEEKWEYTPSGLNFDLTTGNLIKFKDLFTYDASIKNILTHSAYNELARDYTYSEDEEEVDDFWGINMDKIDYSEVESDVFRVVNSYNKNNDIDFYCSPSIITAIIDNKEIRIKMVDYYEQIALYNRFASEDELFENEFEYDKIFNVFLSTYYGDTNYYRVEKVSDNLMVNISITTKGYDDETFDDYDIPKSDMKEIIKKVNDRIEEYKNENDGKGRYFYYSASSYNDNKEDKFDIYENIYTADLDYCEKEFFPYIISELAEISLIDPVISNIYFDSFEDDMKSKVEFEENDNYIDDYEFEDEIFIEDSVESRLIVIDAGHQEKGDSSQEPIGPGAIETKAKVTGGATGVATGQTEYELNLDVALLLQERLENLGYIVVMTRTSNQVNISNSERAEIANNANADAFIRIHANSSDSSSAKGVLTMCQTANNRYNGYLADNSYRLSKLIVDNIAKETGTNNRGVTRTDDMSGINWASVPTTIIEMGFLSNEEEDRLLATKEYQEKIVDGIVKGLNEYFE